MSQGYKIYINESAIKAAILKVIGDRTGLTYDSREVSAGICIYLDNPTTICLGHFSNNSTIDNSSHNYNEITDVDVFIQNATDFYKNKQTIKITLDSGINSGKVVNKVQPVLGEFIVFRNVPSELTERDVVNLYQNL